MQIADVESLTPMHPDISKRSPKRELRTGESGGMGSLIAASTTLNFDTPDLKEAKALLDELA
jgi:hypothetical protein